MVQMLEALGAPNELTPEEDFVIGTLARRDNKCRLCKTLGESASGLRAEAARRDLRGASLPGREYPHRNQLRA
jgi:hypothetical protein